MDLERPGPLGFFGKVLAGPGGSFALAKQAGSLSTVFIVLTATSRSRQRWPHRFGGTEMAAKKKVAKKKSAKKKVVKKAAKKRVAAKRELIDTGHNKLFVRRNARGTSFKEVEDVGRSLAQDRRRKAKAVAKRGQGDRGDRRR